MTTMRGAMPEATVLYSVTAAVFAGLVVWVAVVLKTAKTPWERPALPPVVPFAAAPVAPPTDAEPDPGAATSDGSSGADSTSKATPVALASEAKTRAAAEAATETGDAGTITKTEA